MATKTFKIGECCVGGIIKVTIGKNINIKTLDYYNKEVQYNKDFNIIFGGLVPHIANEIEFYLGGITTSFYAGKIVEWIKSSFRV